MRSGIASLLGLMDLSGWVEAGKRSECITESAGLVSSDGWYLRSLVRFLVLSDCIGLNDTLSRRRLRPRGKFLPTFRIPHLAQVFSSPRVTKRTVGPTHHGRTSRQNAIPRVA